MRERLTIEFGRGENSSYQIAATRFELLGESGNSLGPRQMNSKQPGATGPGLPMTDAVLIVALAFVRVAQWRFVPITADQAPQVPIFNDAMNKRIVTQFFNLRNDVSKRDKHACACLQLMLSVSRDGDEDRHGGRFRKWFSVSQKPSGVVSWNHAALPPETVIVTIGGAQASVAELDAVESYLATKLNAGVPSLLLESQGIRMGGRMPSIQPEVWFWQEDEAKELEEIYASGTPPMVCVVGKPHTGKTVFSKRFLRDLLAHHAVRHKFVFAWTFSREGAALHIPLPSYPFFLHLGNLLGIDLDPKSSPMEMANAVLARLQTHPTFFFLDGIEASFSEAKSVGDLTPQSQIDIGLVHVLRGIAGGNGSFALTTSRQDFRELFGLAPGAVKMLHLKPCADMTEFLKEYADAKTADAEGNLADAALVNIAKKSFKGDSDQDLLQRLRDLRSLSNTIGGLSEPRPEYPLTRTQRDILHLIIERMNGTLSEVLFFVICAHHHSIWEDDLLSIASALPLPWPGDSSPSRSPEDWQKALDSLIASGLLQQADRSSHYSVHAQRKACVAEDFKQRNPAFWAAINRALAELCLKRAPNDPPTKADLPLLTDAAIYLCEAGDRHRAYTEICFERLSQKLQGYAMLRLGDYESAKGIIVALLGDSGLLPLTGLPLEAKALVVQTAAICAEFQGNLKSSLTYAKDAWKLAKAAGTLPAIVTIGPYILYLSCIFGELHNSKAIERRIILVTLKEKLFSVRNNFAADDIVKSAGLMSVWLALSLLYRGKPEMFVMGALYLGGRECKAMGVAFHYLMPGLGRPWHAFVLLEMGQWQTCEMAMNGGEWSSPDDMIPYGQMGFFSLLAAKTLSAKAGTLPGHDRIQTLKAALQWVEKAMSSASNSGHLWWHAQALLTQAQIFMLQAQPDRARSPIKAALKCSKKESFKPLTVDGLMLSAQLSDSEGRVADRRNDALAALTLADEIGYGLRRPILRKLARKTK